MCASRTDLQHHKRPFAHVTPFCADLLSAVRQLKPTALIGVSAQGGAFTQEVRATCWYDESGERAQMANDKGAVAYLRTVGIKGSGNAPYPTLRTWRRDA